MVTQTSRTSKAVRMCFIAQIDLIQLVFPVGNLRFPNTMRSLCPSLLFGNLGENQQIIGLKNHTIPGCDVDV